MKQAICRVAALTGLALVVATPAAAHVGVTETSSFLDGLLHPLGGLDHVLAMVAVGLWATLKAGRAVWVWPAAFVLAMLAAGAMALAGLPLPYVEPGILASIVGLGLLTALAIDLPVAAGAVIVALFAVFHGHAHGAEAPVATTPIVYAAGFAFATAALHGIGIAMGLVSKAPIWRYAVRGAGALAASAGLILIAVDL